MQESKMRKYIESLDLGLVTAIRDITKEIIELTKRKDLLSKRRDITYSLLRQDIKEEDFDKLIEEIRNWD